jgi:hypothetical protein
MAPRVSPKEPNPTNHFQLKDRSGRVLGLTIAQERTRNGQVTYEAPAFRDGSLYSKNPVDTTAQKQTSGSSSYADYDYPYSPIVQDDLSGGRGSVDFERDSTKYYDSFRCRSGRQNKAYAGPLEQWTTGLRNQDQSAPNSVRWVKLYGNTRYVYLRFQASASYTAGLAWLLTRCKGTPEALTVAIYNDSAGSVGTLATSVTAPYTRMNDLLMEWLNETISQALTSGTYYWLVLSGGANDGDSEYWTVACKNAVGTTYYSTAFDSTPTVANFDLYFRLTDANTEKTCIPYEYKEQQYFAISPTSGAPKIYMAGDRGTADANTGQLTKLIDGTKSWAMNEWAGMSVMITDGLGRLEPQTWRTVVSNTATELILDSAWTITHDTTTEYVLLGTKLTEIAGHGLTAPVTSVLVSITGVIYFAMGDTVTVRRMREYTNAGTWTREYADETATTKAVFMVYKPQSQKIVISNNSDASGNVSVSHSSNATIPAWGTALTWAAAVNVDSKYRRINGMIVHPDGSGTEAVWVFKTDVPFIVPGTGNPYPVSIEEMKTVRSLSNGVNPMRHGVYLYFPMLQGLERYYGGQFDDLGPNLGEGLPENRRGSIVSMVGYPGKFFIAIDAGSAGYSSVMDSGGWHERYRAPKGQRITAMAFQVTAGAGLDRLWLWQGNDLIWLPFPSESTNELEDANYPYAPEFAVTLARMHAGMFDVQKLVKKIKLQTDALEVNETNGEPICWFELDYRLNEDDEWTTISNIFSESPTQSVDFTKEYGVAGKRLQFRVRGYTTDASKTPVFLAIIVSAVIRVDVKSFYGPFTFLLKDDERVGLRELDRAYTALEKLKILEDWGDASNDSMLLMNSVSALCDGKMIFLNVGTRRQIAFESAENNEFKGNAFLVSATMQEA